MNASCWFWSVLFGSVMLCVPAFADDKPADTDKKPQVTASVRYAIEDGPVVLNITIRNSSDLDLDLSGQVNPFVWARDDLRRWQLYEEPPRMRVSQRPWTRTICSGSSYDFASELHRDYYGITAGTHRLPWGVYGKQASEWKTFDGEPLTVRVVPATTEALEAVVRDARDLRNQARDREGSLQVILTRVGGTPHPMLNRYLLELLDDEWPERTLGVQRRPYRIVRELYGETPPVLKADRVTFGLITDYLTAHRPRYASALLSGVPHDPDRRKLFREVAGDRLRNAPDVWVRRRWNRDHETIDREARFDAIVRDVRQAMNPLPEAEWRALLVRLDSERFTEREAASSAVVRFGQRTLPQIRTTLEHGKPSAEVRNRLQRGLVRIEADTSTPSENDMIEILATTTEPRDIRLREALLSQNPPSLMAAHLQSRLAEKKLKP